MLAAIPSPPHPGFDIGPVFVRWYALCCIAGLLAGMLITRRRWRAAGGDPRLIEELAIYGGVAGLIGGRIYHELTTGEGGVVDWLAVWHGGSGVWGVVTGGVLACVVVVRRRGADVALFLDALVVGLLVGHVFGRLGNYFNQELFGRPTGLPGGLRIDPANRPERYASAATFHPTFLYESILVLLLAGLLAWLGTTGWVRAPGLFALYIVGYCALRVPEELLRVDPSRHLLGLRLNLYVALIVGGAAAFWFRHTQRRPPAAQGPARDPRPARELR